MDTQEVPEGERRPSLIEQSRQTPDGVLISVRVKPNSPRFMLHDDGTLEVKSAPEKGRANREIIRGLRKLFGCEVKILMGMTSRNKTILLGGMNTETLNSALREE